MSAKRPYGSGSLKVEDGKWRARWRPTPGAPQVRAVIGPARKPGTREGLTRRQAEAKLRELMAAKRAAPDRDDERTLAWAADRMYASMKAVGSVEPQTVDGYARDFNNHVRDVLGAKPLAAVTAEDVEALMTALLDPKRKPKPLSAKSVRNIASQIGQVFKHGLRQRPAWVESNPCDSIDLPKVERDADDVPHLTQPEVTRLLAAIDGADDFATVDRVLYLTAAMCGLRQGELLALRWSHIDWTAQRINVRLNHARKHGDRSPKSKAGRRSVPLPDAVGGALDRLSKASAFSGPQDRVFGHPTTGDVLDYSALDRRLSAAVKAAGVCSITFHGLRHTFAVQCARAGVPMRTLQHWMGHAEISATEIYARFARDQNEVAMLEGAFDSLTQSLTQSERISAQPGTPQPA
jgi:integrase